ncbi:MAG TPA: sigma-70 family RNA polymerase sigma factor [Thermoanaerobaculia bacterium]
MEVQEARELLEANFALVTRAVAFACRRYRFDPDDAEELGAIVHLKLVDDDYAVLRAYEGRSGLATYLSIIIQRWALDYRIHAWGKWHPSAEAKRLGAVAVELEQILHRDGRSVEEALPFLKSKHPGVTLDSLKAIAAKLPRRAPKRHDVPVEEAEPVSGPYDIEDQARAGDRRRTAERVAPLLREAIERRPEDLRLILQLRFVNGMTVAQIARALQREQKLLYRMLERCMHEIQDEIVAAGVRREDVLDLIGRDDIALAFDLGKPGPRPSKESDERVAAPTEGPG